MTQPKSKAKEITLLMLPVVFLLGLTAVIQQPRGDGSLTLVSSRIHPSPMSTSFTEVSAVIKYASPSLLPEIMTRPDYRCLGWKIIDAKGKTLSFKSSGTGVGPRKNYLYGFTFQFPPSELPQAAGKLTLKAVVKVADKTLPLSFVVREA